MGSKIVKIIFGLLVLAAIAVVAGVWMVWKRPLTIDTWMSRSALKINGLESTKLDTEAGRMTVWVGGSGPTLVLLHGAGDQAGAWARTVGGLVTDHRLVIPDLPGHWKSDPRSGPIHMEQLLDGLDRVMDRYCTDGPVVIVGNSMGAWLGFLYAREHPERVARLVAVNGGPLFEPNPQVNIFPTTRDEARETLKGLMGPASPPIPGYVLDDIVRRSATGPAARFAATAGEMGAYLLDGRLDEVDVPVELVWGNADQLLTVEYAQRMVDGLPRARLHVINGCGHVPQRECPLRFLEVLTDALAEAPPAVKEGDPGRNETADDQDLVILSAAMPRGSAGPSNDKASSPCHPELSRARTGPIGRGVTSPTVIALKSKLEACPYNTERLCSGKLPACHCLVPGEFVIGSESRESKDPQRVRMARLVTTPLKASGDPSTHSSDSFAQVDMRLGSRVFSIEKKSVTGGWA